MFVFLNAPRNKSENIKFKCSFVNFFHHPNKNDEPSRTKIGLVWFGLVLCDRLFNAKYINIIYIISKQIL